mgnify:CR=1 FL=1
MPQPAPAWPSQGQPRPPHQAPQPPGGARISDMEMRGRLEEMNHRRWLMDRGGDDPGFSWAKDEPMNWRERFKRKAVNHVIQNKMKKLKKKMDKASEKLFRIANQMKGPHQFHSATGVDYMSMYQPTAGVAHTQPTQGTARVSANRPLPSQAPYDSGFARAAANRPLSLERQPLPTTTVPRGSMGMQQFPPPPQPPPQPPPIPGAGYSIPTPWQR